MPPQTKLTVFIRCVILLATITLTLSQDSENEKLVAELRWSDYELSDACDDIAKGRKTAFLTKNFQKKVESEQSYGTLLRSHIEGLKNFTDVPSDLQRNWTYHVKPGDGALPEEKWNKFVSYVNSIEEFQIQIKLPCLNGSEGCVMFQTDFQNVLRYSRNYTELKNIWEAWQASYNDSQVDQFSNHFHLVKEAAELNDFDEIFVYWETLNDFQQAYDQADTFWEEIAPFYRNFHKFVKARLFRYYNITGQSEDIPVYLLGSSLGYDWSNIADIILPHRQIHYDAETYLKYKNLKDIYKYAENVARKMSLGALGGQFWKNSQFNASTCGPQLFEFCAEGYTEIHDCNTPSWTSYLDAHQVSFKVALNNMDYDNLPRNNLRFSVIDECVEILGSLIAIESLTHHGILNKNTFENVTDDDPVVMTKLLLTALRVLPGLPYYLMADKWRLKDVELKDVNLSQSWWKYRKDYQKVSGMHGAADFLEDRRILTNKPYISKFFGTLIAFQLFKYYKDQVEAGDDLAKHFGSDDAFKAMIYERHSEDFSYLLSLHYGLEVTSADLLTYFQSLEDYFESAPLDQVPIVTTTTTTTTTTTSTTTVKPTVVSKTKDNLKNVLVSDEPKVNMSSEHDIQHSDGRAGDNHLAMYTGLGLLLAVGCLIAMALGYKKLKRKRRTNNRRFDT